SHMVDAPAEVVGHRDPDRSADDPADGAGHRGEAALLQRGVDLACTERGVARDVDDRGGVGPGVHADDMEGVAETDTAAIATVVRVVADDEEELDLVGRAARG